MNVPLQNFTCCAVRGQNIAVNSGFALLRPLAMRMTTTAPLRRRGNGAGLLISIVSLLTLSGCASVQVHLGMKVYLDKTPLASMSASLPNGLAIRPGQKSPLVVTFAQSEGKTLQTEGAGHGKVMWKDLQVTATVVTVNQKGVLALPGDPRISDGKVPHVTITVPSHPELRADLDIPVRYDEKYTANFSGSTGMSGNNGLDGMNGASGSTGSMDPNNPSPGGNGSDGTNGSDGQDGGPGGNAPPVHVRVAFRAGTPPFSRLEFRPPVVRSFIWSIRKEVR